MAKIFNFHLTAALLSGAAATGGEITKPDQLPAYTDKLPPGYVVIPREEWEPETLEHHGIQQFEEKHFADALELLRMASMRGRGKAQYYLGKLYAEGLVGQKDPAEAIRWFRKAVRRGYLPAYAPLVTGLLLGIGTEKHPDEAFRLSKTAAELGNAEAQWWLGQCYQWGHGVQTNLDQAERWYRRAAVQGDPNGKSLLAAFLHCPRLSDMEEKLWKSRGASLYDVPIVGDDSFPALKSIRTEAYMWDILSTNENYAWLVENRTEPVKSEAFRRAAAWVPRKESTNDWISGAEPPLGLGETKATGTGFFISDDGYLLSNFHLELIRK